MGKWGEVTTQRFVELYQQNQCLWNMNTSEYRNRKTRETALAKIVKEMEVPGFGIAEAKQKIKNLRSTYSQELAKIEKSIKSGADSGSVYVPTLKWFYVMHSFIQMMGRKRSGEINLDDICKMEKDDHDSNHGDGSDLDASNHGNLSIKSEDIINSPKAKVRRLSTEYKGDAAVQTVPNDEYEIFGKHVSSQLRIMSTEANLLCQEEIQRIITQYRLQDIKFSNK